MKSLLPLLLPLIALQQFTNPCCDAQDCNFTRLAKSLIEDDENMYQLSQVFFPPVENSPEFVKVTYIFTETSETQTWYWSTFTSNFIHPPEVMQFMSLFFTKPHHFFSSDVQLSLTPPDSNSSISGCARYPQRMQLLTQRLQLYASQQKHPVTLDSSYIGKAYLAYVDANTSDLKQFTIEKAANGIDIQHLSWLTPFVTIILSVGIIVTITLLFQQSKQDHWGDKMEKRKPLICSIAVVSLLVTAFNTTLSVCAAIFWSTRYTNMPLYNHDQTRTGGIVGLLVGVDIILLFLWYAFLQCSGVAGRKALNDLFKGGGTTADTGGGSSMADTGGGGNKDCGCCTFKRKFKCKWPPWYIVLSFTIFCPIISVMAHSPYISIGYINDGHHAGSIFIYYTVVICIGYAICWVGFHPQDVLHKPKPKQKDEDKKYNGWVSIAAFVALFVYVGIVVTVTVYFVFIPINKSISDTPDHLAGIFRSGAFIIAAFVLYKMINFFYKSRQKTSLEKAFLKITETSLKDPSDQDWKDKKDRDKIDELYEVIVHIISDDYNKRKKQEPQTGNQGQSTAGDGGQGQSTAGDGDQGQSTAGDGDQGQSTAGGQGQSTAGDQRQSTAGDGDQGQSTAGDADQRQSTAGDQGQSTAGDGDQRQSTAGGQGQSQTGDERQSQVGNKGQSQHKESKCGESLTAAMPASDNQSERKESRKLETKDDEHQ